MSIQHRIASLGHEVRDHIEGIEAHHGEGNRSVEMHWPSGAVLIFDPTLEMTGFMLKITADTPSGPLEATFSPQGELRRGMLGDDVNLGAETLIRLWRDACGDTAATLADPA